MAGFILIVEDDFDIRETLQHLFESEGYQVESAENGRDALNRLEQIAPPQLILLDLMMPVMNGWEFLEDFRKNSAWSQIPVVVMSAVAQSQSTVTGVRDTMKKPLDIDQVLAITEKYCGKPSPA